MLRQRIITAVLMALAFLATLFLLPEPSFGIFITLVLFAGLWEWANLSSFMKNWQRLIYSLIGLALVVFTANYTGLLQGTPNEIDEQAIFNVLLAAATWWALALLWIQGYPSSAIFWRSRWIRAIIGWFVLIPTWLALVYLYQTNGPRLILLVMFTIFVADTGAYFTGRIIGKHKLAAQISPGKTLEGLAGGIFFCTLFALLISVLTNLSEWPIILLIIILTAFASVLGDLLESMVKRERKIKDSSSLLPGHGGVMDRLDSISAATPVFALALIISGWSPS
ncbi:MAG: phosphatidate cytidylyltransferase [Cellvibrionaceae bacterium]|jgi:phosphatidate cytidylyltransferase